MEVSEGGLNARDIVIQTLANDFLNVSDTNIDLRSYLVETTLPTVVLAMERLLKEIDSRENLSNENDEQNENTGESELSSQKPKNVKPAFDPLNWLAQYLYRNNPRYSNFTDQNASPYLKSMRDVGMALKTRMFETDTNKRTKRKTDEVSKKHKEEHEEKVKSLVSADRKNTVEELLSTFFKKWTKALWRTSPAFLTRKELILEIESMLSLFSDSMHKGVREQSSELLQFLKESTEEGIVASQHLSLSSFVETIEMRTRQWSVDLLSDFLIQLSQSVERTAARTQSLFDSFYALPEFFKDSESHSCSEVKKELWNLFSDLGISDVALHEKRNLRDAFRQFCHVDDNEPDQGPFEQEFLSFAKSLVGEFGIESIRSLFSKFKDAGKISLVESDDVKMSKFINAIDSNATEISVRKFNSAIESMLERTIFTEEMKKMMSLLKVNAPARTILSKKMSREELLAHIGQVSKDFNRSVFRELLDIFALAYQSDQEDGTIQKAVPKANSTAILEEEEEKESASREDVEKEAIEHIEALHIENEPISSIANQCITIVVNALREIHHVDSIVGYIGLKEENSDSQPQLRCVASLESQVSVGSIIPSDRTLEYQTLQSSQSTLLDDIRTAYPASPESWNGSLCISPIRHVDKNGLGLLCILTNKDLILTSRDQLFIETCTRNICKVLTSADRQIKLFTLGKSLKEWIEQQTDIQVQLHLVKSVQDATSLYNMVMHSQSEETNESPYFNKPYGQLEPADKGNDMTPQVMSCYAKMEKVEFSSGSNKFIVIPVLKIDDGSVLFTSIQSPAEAFEAEDLVFVDKTISTLSQGLEASLKLFGIQPSETSEEHLAGELIDSEAKRELAFPKLLLQSTKRTLESLDSKMISEFKSYKKPPKAIHKIIKAALYIFGSLPKDVKTWSDTLKYITQDFLKQMLEYDPTAIQKVSRIKRCKRVLSNIAKNEVKKKGASAPADAMYQWLLISMDLRDKAVEGRKRHAEQYEQEASQLASTEELVEETFDDDSEVAFTED